MGSDDIGLIYMNARYYVPGIARFASADTIVPNPANPQSISRYSYVENNPVNRSDPSGHCGADKQTFVSELANPVSGTIESLTFIIQDAGKLADCKTLRDELEDLYDISIFGSWTLEEMELFRDGLQGIIDRFAGIGLTDPIGVFKEIWGGANFFRRDSDFNPLTTVGSNIIITNLVFKKSDGTDKEFNTIMTSIAHELMHVWDKREGSSLSEDLKDIVGGSGDTCAGAICVFNWNYDVTIGSPSVRNDNGKIKNSREDLAASFATFIVDPTSLEQERRVFFEELLMNFNN